MTIVCAGFRSCLEHTLLSLHVALAAWHLRCLFRVTNSNTVKTPQPPLNRDDKGVSTVQVVVIKLYSMYTFVHRCPKYPPLPRYCSLVDVPGQCCPSMHCNIPDIGAYTPIPQTEPRPVPTMIPGAVPSQNPQMVLSGLLPMTGASNLPGNGYILSNPSAIGGISGEHVVLSR